MLRQERLLTIIRGPHLSEKAHIAAENNQVVLKVRTDATKKEVQQAVELLFEVKVVGVQVVNVKGKTKRFQQTKGRRPNWKKAYVKLAEGSSIEELFGTE
ncbi:MAG: 50S ribosomal protein L23 [Proteobacteria bacterium]|nr:50S ribosomal protein L23 [Pseudomonadota bacterium]